MTLTPQKACIHATPLPREAPALDAIFWVCADCGWRTELFARKLAESMRLHPLEVAVWGPHV